MRRLSLVIAIAAATCAFPLTSLASPGPSSTALSQSQAQRRAESRAFVATANALPKIRALRAEYPDAFEVLKELPDGNREVIYFEPNGSLPPKEIGLVVIDGRSHRVLEAWTGLQLDWALARGTPGYVGRHVSALYIWLPMCVLFLLPFFNVRRPLSLLHLDLLVLVSFSVSLAFFNHGRIYASVPLAYPPLLYLLARMLALTRPRYRLWIRAVQSEKPPLANVPAESPPERTRPLHLLVPVKWLALGVVFLIAFRVALNVTDSNVIDVGEASVIGAQRLVQGKPLYGSYPQGRQHADTYGPANYEAYVPFEQVFGPNRPHGAQAAAHAAAIVFDLLAVVLIFLLGRRVRGPTLGIALAYAWVSYPFTLYVLEANSNDALVSVLVLAALLAASYRSSVARTTRGALSALAGLTKFAPLAIAPLLATHGLAELPRGRRPRALGLFMAGFLGAAALAFIPALSHDSPHTIYERTIAFQTNRTSPFSVWGLYGGLGGLQLALQVAVVVLAVTLALVPRRPDLVGLAAACTAVIVATQLGVTHWFYLYIPWFFPLAMLALLGRFGAPRWNERASRSPGAVRDDRGLVGA